MEMNKANKKIREAMYQAGFPYWVLADLLKVHRCTLSEWLRHEMPQEKQEEILKLIERESKRRKNKKS